MLTTTIEPSEKWHDNGLSPLKAMRVSAPEGRTFINATEE